MSEIKSRPILFSSPMVKAILEGNKCQTRRVIKPQPLFNCRTGETFYTYPTFQQHRNSWIWGADITADVSVYDEKYCPFGKIGQRLWVRETWQIKNGGGVIYKADGVEGFLKAYPNEIKQNYSLMKWKPSIFMRRKNSRIILEITNIRVEKVQAISPTDVESD